MANERILRIVNLLIERTNRGTIDWAPSSEPKRFIAPFSNFSVGIRPDHADYVLDIFDKEGSLVESIRDTQLTAAMPDSFSQMSDMYQAARRKALGIDAALQSFLGELEKE